LARNPPTGNVFSGHLIENANRVVRGGSWNNDAQNARAAYRNGNHPENRWNNLGFRCLSSGEHRMMPNEQIGGRSARMRAANSNREPVRW
jgi:hypothetical protein